MTSILSKRASDSLSGSHSNYLNDAFMKWYSDPYDPETNPEGCLNLGTAENRLVSDILKDKLDSITRYEPESQYYFDKRGFSKFRSTLASFLDSHLRTTTPLDPDNLIVTNGASAALDTLGHVLADGGDAFLGVTPCYRRIENNLGERSRVDMIPVHLSSTNDYRLTSKDLEASLESAIRSGRTVRGIILMNPHNPLGTILLRESILDILEFAKTHQLHVVFDEVFALTVFESGVQFCSVASLSEVLPDPERTHFYWGFSKDMSLSGFRCGVIYSWNAEVIKALTVLTSFHALSAPIQLTLNALLSDRNWLDRVYFPENKKRLKTARDEMALGLRQMGLRVLDCVAGFCLWVDLTGIFADDSVIRNEDSFFRRLLAEARIYIVPGSELLSQEKGWARILFACSAPERREFLRRLKKFDKDLRRDAIVC